MIVIGCVADLVNYDALLTEVPLHDDAKPQLGGTVSEYNTPLGGHTVECAFLPEIAHSTVHFDV